MGEVIDFPVRDNVQDERSQQNHSQENLSQQTQSIILEDDPYYLFLRNVLITADSCGFELPVTVESAAELVYRRTRKTSQLAKMMYKD